MPRVGLLLDSWFCFRCLAQPLSVNFVSCCQWCICTLWFAAGVMALRLSGLGGSLTSNIYGVGTCVKLALSLKWDLYSDTLNYGSIIDGYSDDARNLLVHVYICSDNAFLQPASCCRFPDFPASLSQRRHLLRSPMRRDCKVAGLPAHHWSIYLSKILHQNVVPFGFDPTSSTFAGGRRFGLQAFSHLLAV